MDVIRAGLDMSVGRWKVLQGERVRAGDPGR
jgi:hypothetical protein